MIILKNIYPQKYNMLGFLLLTALGERMLLLTALIKGKMLEEKVKI